MDNYNEVPTSGNNRSRKKNIGIVIGCFIGTATLTAILLIIFINHSGKIVTCTMNTTTMGIAIREETHIRVGNGELSGGDMIVNVNLKTIRNSYKDYEEEIVNEMTERYKEHCEDHCKFDYSYAKGDNVKYTILYDKEGISEIIWDDELENMSEQEIANKIQELLEDSNTICTQN